MSNIPYIIDMIHYDYLNVQGWFINAIQLKGKDFKAKLQIFNVVSAN